MTQEYLTREEWTNQQREAWRVSGSDLDFGAWQQKRADERREDLDRIRDAEIEAEDQVRRMARLEKATPPRYRSAVTEEPALCKWVDSLVVATGEVEVPSVLLAGPTGTGKTHAMFGALRRYVHAGGRRNVTAVTMADLYAQLRPSAQNNSEEVLSRYMNAELLALDDFGAAKGSEWVDEINYRLINHRYNNLLPTLVTSNVLPRDLRGMVGERVASRLREMCEQIVLLGNDRRQPRSAA